MDSDLRLALKFFYDPGPFFYKLLLFIKTYGSYHAVTCHQSLIFGDLNDKTLIAQCVA